MRLLVTGSESSGTRMLSVLLTIAGAAVVHSSPAYKRKLGQGYDPQHYDAVILIVRNGAWNAQSLVNRGHLMYDSPERQIVEDMTFVLTELNGKIPIYIVTYESLVHEQPHSFNALCKQIGLVPVRENGPIPNANEKFYGEGWEGDDRTIEERLTTAG